VIAFELSVRYVSFAPDSRWFVFRLGCADLSFHPGARCAALSCAAQSVRGLSTATK